jgi:hypothetical protein
MKLELCCDAASKILLAAEVIFEEADRTYTFSPGTDGTLSKVSIAARIKHPDRFIRRFVPGGFLEQFDGELYDSLIRELQYLESVLAFTGELEHIRWDAPTTNLIYEADAERASVVSGSLRLEKKWRVVPIKFAADKLQALIRDRHIIETAMVVQGFFREGKNELHQYRFINAFYNFFFVLEGLYGNGKTGTDKLRDEFWRSAAFSKVVSECGDFLCSDDASVAKQLLEELTERGKEHTLNNVVDLLIDTRGSTHHFSVKSTKEQGTPFRQSEYEAIACFSYILASNAINEEVHRLHATYEAQQRANLPASNLERPDTNDRSGPAL